jgi:tryptophan synthase beta chain
MHSLGHSFVPAPIHAGGLRYHGMAPIVSQLVSEGIMESKTVTQLEAYKAGVLFARTEGMIPAPETNHAIASVIDEANKAKEEAYDKYFSGEMKDYILTDEEMLKAEEVFANYPKPALLKSR